MNILATGRNFVIDSYAQSDELVIINANCMTDALGDVAANERTRDLFEADS